MGAGRRRLPLDDWSQDSRVEAAVVAAYGDNKDLARDACPADAPRLPALDYNAYTRVVYAGVSFRRFAQIWRPERHQFFKPDFQARVETLLAAAVRGRSTGAALGRVPDVVLHDVLAFASSKGDARRDDYDDLATVNSGQRHLFLPAPGSSGIRDHLFDAVFGL